jgi:O-antigen ligase
LNRLAAAAITLGAVGAAVAVSTYTLFELDRFFIPKELVLHLTALAGGVLAFRAMRALELSRVDVLLLLYLLLSAISAGFAPNRWLGGRAAAISASAILLFWIARALRGDGWGRYLTAVAAFAAVVAAVTALLQAYGMESLLFSENRAPGGTLGNRNFIGHVAAIGLPLVLAGALGARRAIGTLFGGVGIALVSAALVLTRSRAAWLAAAVAVLLFLALALRRMPFARLLIAVTFAAGGIVAALAVPNTLQWRSDNPYLDSVIGVTRFDEGSGRARLIHYQRSMVLAARYPLLGVGPGNWPVRYPENAPSADPAMNPGERGMTFNPWPSSDWVAFVSERGFMAAGILALALGMLALDGVRSALREEERESVLAAAALAAAIAGAVIAGALDAVLLLALPALMVFLALGALWSPAENARRVPWPLVVLLIAASAAGAFRNAAQLVSMDALAMNRDRATLRRAARVDPGNYRLHLRLARGARRAERCAHARAAHSLYPAAAAPRALMRGCGK